MSNTCITQNMSPNFITTNVILSMKKAFTYEEAVAEVKKYISSNCENLVKLSIARLRESDYLDENGSYYTVIENEKSKRWSVF